MDISKDSAQRLYILTLILLILFVQIMLSAYDIGCLYSNAFQTNLAADAITVNPDQTTPEESGSILFAI